MWKSTASNLKDLPVAKFGRFEKKINIDSDTS